MMQGRTTQLWPTSEPALVLGSEVQDRPGSLHQPQCQCSTSYQPACRQRRDVSRRAQLAERPAGTKAQAELSLPAQRSRPAETQAQAEPSLPAQRSTSRPEERILYLSTPRERAWVWATFGLLGANLAVALPRLHSSGDWAAAGGAAVFAYLLSDFLSGVYHWSVDNYGDGSTPVVGSQIAAFQGHHQEPWTITQREFCNNVHKVFQPAFPFLALCLAASAVLAPPLQIGLAMATVFTCMSQQFHAWAHTKASRLPAAVIALQDAGLLVSRRAHGAHHRAPFEGNYCIVSGIWNDPLDKSGFFRRLETWIAARTGVEPRCWHEPKYSWQEC